MFQSFLKAIIDAVINPLILLLATAAFVVVLWGAFQLITSAADDTKRKTAKDAVVWGIVGLVVMFSAYGLINLALSTFGVQSTVQSKLP